MKAFIEVDAGMDQRPIWDEKTLKKIRTKKVYKPYPYAYGFLLDTLSGDGENLDCYVITSKFLEPGKIFEVEPFGMVESVENGEDDHKILCCLLNEKISIDFEIKQKILDFGEHYFDDCPDKDLKVGRFLNKKEAVKLINSCRKD
jgi:inorganic pyrophosphatase